ncbi:MAG TPA: hypothetical protein VE913_09310 [Longimicrobium sp.]|nr:hypothetical protein [Longimicrobium sp.]
MDIHITTGDSRYDYEVPDDLLAALRPFEGNPPNQITELELVTLLRSKAEAYARRGGDPRAVLVSHMRNCAAALGYITGSSTQREMIGEILAAVAVRKLGWTMVHGYGGSGHTGLDQLWTGGDRILVVECKGGNAQLDTRPRYFQGCTHEGTLGMNANVTQMSTAWVFMACNSSILGSIFGASMLNDIAPAVVVLTPGRKAALLVCLALWDPAEFQRQGGAKHIRWSPAGPIAPTGHFNALMGWQGGMAITLPRVQGAVVRNGNIVNTFEYAPLRHVLTETMEAPRLNSGGRGRFGAFDPKDFEDDDQGGGPKPHRFQPSLLAQLKNRNKM